MVRELACLHRGGGALCTQMRVVVNHLPHPGLHRLEGHGIPAMQRRLVFSEPPAKVMVVPSPASQCGRP